MRMRTSTTAVVVAGVLALGMRSGLATAQIEPQRLVGGPAAQYEPHGNGKWIVWSQNSVDHPETWHAYARRIGGTTVVRLDAAGTEGQTGGFVPGTDRVVYEQWTNHGGGLYIFDLETRKRWKVAGVDTGWYEGLPRISSTFVLFTRWVRRDGRWYADLLLHRRETGTTRRLGSWLDGGKWVYTGSVGDRYATWTLCSDTDCWAYVYDAQTSTTSRVGTDNGAYQYAPVIDEANGDVYFARSAPQCGHQAGVWKVPVDSLGAEAEQIAALPSGIDTGWTLSLAPNADATALDIYFERYACGPNSSDAYAFRDVIPMV